MKLVSAFGVALVTLVLQIYVIDVGSTAFMLGVIIYLGLSDLFSSMNGVERFRGLKIGIGVYFFTWVTTWVLLYTIVQTLG